jgi:hypothetical protein
MVGWKGPAPARMVLYQLGHSRQELGHSGTYLGQRHWTYAVHTHAARTIGDAPWATTIGSWATGEKARTGDPEQTPARKKKSY